MKNKTGYYIRTLGLVITIAALAIFVIAILVQKGTEAPYLPPIVPILLYGSASAILPGIILIGIGEIINLLQDIRDSIHVPSKNTPTDTLMNFKPTEKTNCDNTQPLIH